MGKEKNHGKKKFSVQKLFVYLFLIAGSLASLFPFYYMFVMATRINREINQVPPPFTPGADLVSNFQKVLNNIDFFGAMWNSFFCRHNCYAWDVAIVFSRWVHICKA